MDCYRIRNDHVEDTKYTLNDEVFSKCTTFNIHLEASSPSNMRLRDLRSEMSIANKTAECWLTNEKMLVIILSGVMLLLLSIALLICYYHSKKVRRFNDSTFKVVQPCNSFLGKSDPVYIPDFIVKIDMSTLSRNQNSRAS